MILYPSKTKKKLKKKKVTLHVVKVYFKENSHLLSSGPHTTHHVYIKCSRRHFMCYQGNQAAQLP